MDTILFVFIGMMCLMMGVRVYCAEERTKVFNKRHLPIEDKEDIKKYNHFCGGLILGFGVVAEITAYFMVVTTGLVSTLCTLGIIVEAFVTVTIYSKYEQRLIKKVQESRKKK